MARQIVVSSIVATAVAAALVLLTREQPAVAVAPPSNGDAAALSALRDELRALREDVAELRALRTTAAPAPVEPPPAQEVQPYDDEPPQTARPAAAAGDTQAAYRAELAQTEKRFAKLGELVRAQSRNASWASAREAEITGLVTRHEYFKNTTFDTVECRTTLCRVVASFPNEAALDQFVEVFPGFVPSLPDATLRPIPGSNPPRTEVFLSIDGPLPR